MTGLLPNAATSDGRAERNVGRPICTPFCRSACSACLGTRLRRSRLRRLLQHAIDEPLLHAATVRPSGGPCRGSGGRSRRCSRARPASCRRPSPAPHPSPGHAPWKFRPCLPESQRTAGRILVPGHQSGCRRRKMLRSMVLLPGAQRARIGSDVLLCLDRDRRQPACNGAELHFATRACEHCFLQALGSAARRLVASPQGRPGGQRDGTTRRVEEWPCRQHRTTARAPMWPPPSASCGSASATGCRPARKSAASTPTPSPGSPTSRPMP